MAANLLFEMGSEALNKNVATLSPMNGLNTHLTDNTDNITNNKQSNDNSVNEQDEENDKKMDESTMTFFW